MDMQKVAAFFIPAGNVVCVKTTGDGFYCFPKKYFAAGCIPSIHISNLGDRLIVFLSLR